MSESSTCAVPATPTDPHGAARAVDMWSKFVPDAIPSKKTLHVTFTDAVAMASSSANKGHLLDLGCGNGRIAMEIAVTHPSLTVVGQDCNQDAVLHAEANSKARAWPAQQRPVFYVGDCASAQLRAPSPSGLFDTVLAQLLISVVGGPTQRADMLRAAFLHLQPGGYLLLSASGASEAISEHYRSLYDADAKQTGEYRTYYSRDSAGAVLYTTHHFEEDELTKLLTTAGFSIHSFVVEKETSSRSATRAAYFHYVVATKPREGTN